MLEIIDLLQQCLIDITGMDTITLQPAAGAHGEFTGILLVRAWHESQGNARRKSAHSRLGARNKSRYRSHLRLPGGESQVECRRRHRPRSAGPPGGRRHRRADAHQSLRRIGVFENEIHKIADILHAKGALLYMDGANMNALVGKVRPGDFGVDVMHLNLHKTFSTPHGGGGPGSGPVACKEFLEPFLPTPVLCQRRERHDHWEYNRPQSVGRVRAFYGNTGMFIRALAYILANGRDGLRQTTEDAVLNANYIRKKLEDLYELPYKTPSMHEVVFSDKRQAAKGVKTGDIAKRLIDYGFHPYTVSFPLIVPGALMIEPTESESVEELDLFIAAMRSIAKEVEETPELVKTAPHSTRVSRLDEVTAARKPMLRWKPGLPPGGGRAGGGGAQRGAGE